MTTRTQGTTKPRMYTPKPPPRVPEKAIQKAIKDALEALGYRVVETGKARARSKATGEYATGWQGNTPGCPDLFITGDGWPDILWIAAECKGDGTDITPAQVALRDAGRTVIVRSVGDAVRAVHRVEYQLMSWGWASASHRFQKIGRFLRDNEGKGLGE